MRGFAMSTRMDRRGMPIWSELEEEDGGEFGFREVRRRPMMQKVPHWHEAGFDSTLLWLLPPPPPLL